MHPLRVSDDTYLLSVNVENILFEGLWEMPNGVAPNPISWQRNRHNRCLAGWDGVPNSCINFWELDIDPQPLSI